MIFYFLLLCLHTCHCTSITRGELFDTLKGGVACRHTCTCRSPAATFLNLLGDGKCIGANGTGCSLKVDGYTTDVPLIRQSMLKKTEFRITKDGGKLCSNTFGTYEASSARMLALTDSWEIVPAFMSNSFSYSIPNVKEIKVTFHTIWSGLLIKLIVKCKASNGKEYTPRENCVLFKYEGTATYPLTLSSFDPEPETTKTPLTKPATTTTTATTTIPKKSTNKITTARTIPTIGTITTTTTATTKALNNATGSLSSVLTTFTTATTEARFNKLTSCECNKKLVIVSVTAGAIILFLILIVIILICKVKKLDQTKIKQFTKNNVTEPSFEYEYPEVKFNETVDGEQQGNNKQGCQDVQDNKNYAPLIFDSKENVTSNYTSLSKVSNEIPMNRNMESL